MKLTKTQRALFAKSVRRQNRPCASLHCWQINGGKKRSEGAREVDALRSLVNRGLAVYLSIDSSTIPQWNSATKYVSEYSWRLTPAGLDLLPTFLQ